MNKIDEINKKIDDCLKQLTEKELDVFFKRALSDSHKLFLLGDNEDINKVAFSIYKAYVLGTAVERSKK